MPKVVKDLVIPVLTDNTKSKPKTVGAPEYTKVDKAKLDIENIIDRPKMPNLNTAPTCPRCYKPLVWATAISGTLSTGWMECPECGTLVNTYKPLPHQVEFFKRAERYKMCAGGYGSGKTKEDIEDISKHLCLIPNAVVCVAARTYPALESTFVKDFYAVFPKKLVKSKNDQKHELYLTNGSMVMFRSFDDPTKLKSLNLTMAVIVEASDVPYDGFSMLQTRIRNTAAMIPEYDALGNIKTVYDENTQTFVVKYAVDARHINLETNPASNWVKSKFLQDSHMIKYFGSARDEGYAISRTPDTNKYTQIVSTDANPYLPSTYIAENSKGKSQAWIMQFLYGSFNFNLNLVFPNFGLCITNDQVLPRAYNEKGRRVLWYAIGLDYGIRDNTHVIFTALSTETHKLYVYDELVINNADIKTIAKEYRAALRRNGTDLKGLLMQPRFDGRSYNKRESDLHTIGGAFEAEGLYFTPSFANNDIRILKVNALINHSQLVVFSKCEFLIDEVLNYEYKRNSRGEVTNSPEDGHDHGVTALEFIISDLPYNLEEIELEAYIPAGTEIKHDTKPLEDLDEHKSRQPIYNPFEEDKHDNYNSTVVYNNRNINNKYFYVNGTHDTDEETDFGLYYTNK